MEMTELVKKFSESRQNQLKAIFSTIFIAANRIQTAFDKEVPEVTLKQFMLISIVRQTKETLTLTELGKHLGCSRQNVKKLAEALEKKGFVKIEKNSEDSRAAKICRTQKLDNYFEDVFEKYQENLGFIFEDYSDKEINAFFELMMKLYGGIEKIEKRQGEKANEQKFDIV